MKKVLIIDDCADSRFTLKALLEIYNVKIIEAPDGIDGWTNIVHDKPDLVLLDLQMPQRDGCEVLDDIKEEWVDVPVVIISGENSEKTPELCLSNGAKVFIKSR